MTAKTQWRKSAILTVNTRRVWKCVAATELIWDSAPCWWRAVAALSCWGPTGSRALCQQPQHKVVSLDEPSLPVAPGPVPPHSCTCCPPKLSQIFLAAVCPAEEQPSMQQHGSPAPGSPGDRHQHAEGTDESRSNWSLAFQLGKWGLSASQTLQWWHIWELKLLTFA